MDPSLLLTSLKYWSCPARPDWKEREEELRKKAESLAARLRTSKERVSQLSQETDSCKSHESELARVVREQEAKTRAQEEALNSSRAEVLKIKTDVNASKLATAEVEKQLRVEIAEARKLLQNQENQATIASKYAAERLETLQKTLDAGAVEAASLKQKTADLEKSLAREQTKIAIATEEVSTLRSNLKDAKVSLEQETSRRIRLEKDAAEAQTAFDTIKAETDSRISQLEGTTTAATVEIDNLRTSLAAANSKTVRERNAIKELEAIVKSLEMKATEATKGVQEITDRVMDVIYDKTRVQTPGKGSFDDDTSVATAPMSPRDPKTLEDAIDSARTETDNLISMFTKFEQDAESRIQTLKTTLGTSSTDNETVRASERAARESLTAAQSELDVARKELDMVMLKSNEALEECRGQTLAANKSVSELQAQLKAATRPENIMYIEDLQSQIAGLNAKVLGLEKSQLEFQNHFATALRAEMSAIDAEEMKNTRESVNKQHADAIQIIESKRIVLTTELRSALDSVSDVVQIATNNATLSAQLRADIERMNAELKTTQELTSICKAKHQLAKDTNQRLQDTIETHLKTIETERAERGNHIAAQEVLRQEIQKQSLAASTTSDYLNQKKIDVLQAALKSAEDGQGLYVSKGQAAEKTIAELEGKLQANSLEAKTSRDELTAQGKKAELCTSTLASLKLAHADVQKRLATAEDTLKISSVTIGDHERTIESLKLQLAAANSSGNDATAALTRELEALRTSYSELEEREKLHASAEEILRKQIAELEQSAKSVKEAFEAEITEARDSSVRSDDEIRALRAAMEAMQKEHADALVKLNQKLADETTAQDAKLNADIETEIQYKQKRLEQLKQFEKRELRGWEIYGQQMDDAIKLARSEQTRARFRNMLDNFNTKNNELLKEVDGLSKQAEMDAQLDVRPRPQRLKDIEFQLVRLELFEDAVTKRDEEVLNTLREAIQMVNEEDASTAELKEQVQKLTESEARLMKEIAYYKAAAIDVAASKKALQDKYDSEIAVLRAREDNTAKLQAIIEARDAMIRDHEGTIQTLEAKVMSLTEELDASKILAGRASQLQADLNGALKAKAQAEFRNKKPLKPLQPEIPKGWKVENRIAPPSYKLAAIKKRIGELKDYHAREMEVANNLGNGEFTRMLQRLIRLEDMELGLFEAALPDSSPPTRDAINRRLAARVDACSALLDNIQNSGLQHADVDDVKERVIALEKLKDRGWPLDVDLVPDSARSTESITSNDFNATAPKDFNSTMSTMEPSPRVDDEFFSPSGGDESLPSGGNRNPGYTPVTPEPPPLSRRVNVRAAVPAPPQPKMKQSYGPVKVTRGGLR